MRSSRSKKMNTLLLWKLKTLHKKQRKNGMVASKRLYLDYKFKENYLNALKIISHFKEGEDCTFHPQINHKNYYFNGFSPSTKVATNNNNQHLNNLFFSKQMSKCTSPQKSQKELNYFTLKNSWKKPKTNVIEISSNLTANLNKHNKTFSLGKDQPKIPISNKNEHKILDYKTKDLYHFSNNKTKSTNDFSINSNGFKNFKKNSSAVYVFERKHCNKSSKNNQSSQERKIEDLFYSKQTVSSKGCKKSSYIQNKPLLYISQASTVRFEEQVPKKANSNQNNNALSINSGLFSLNVRSYSQNSHITLQSISDGKINELANHYLETDDSLDRFRLNLKKTIY